MMILQARNVQGLSHPSSANDQGGWVRNNPGLAVAGGTAAVAGIAGAGVGIAALSGAFDTENGGGWASTQSK